MEGPRKISKHSDTMPIHEASPTVIRVVDPTIVAENHPISRLKEVIMEHQFMSLRIPKKMNRCLKLMRGILRVNSQARCKLAWSKRQKRSLRLFTRLKWDK